MKAPRKRVTVIAAVCLVAAACGSDQTGGATSSATTAPPATASTTPPGTTLRDTTAAVDTSPSVDSTGGSTASEGSAVMGSGPIDPGLGPYIDIAVADLAQRIGVGADQIEVTSATLKQWPDSSIGCPQKGMQYTQVLTDGALIVLTVEGKTYKYHSGGSRPPFYCADSKATPGDATAGGSTPSG